MKIEDASVRLDAGHARDSRRRFEVINEIGFSRLMAEADAALPPESGRDARAEMEKIRRLLQELLATVLALLGEKSACKQEASVADLDGAAPRPAAAGRVFEWKTTTVEHVEEHECTTVSACGEVRTADGRRIDFSLSLEMRRDYVATRETVEQGRVVFKDPLAVNFAGKAAALTGKRFAFDLDADGRTELLPELATGSGYLCFDANADGRIADGRELFGAAGRCAGDGFADLARHDADGNGWIDEADPAYAALGVWFPDGRIESLKTAGVGAMNLASVASPFALRDADNAPLGEIRRTGVFLHEDGRIGSLQQIDLGTVEAGGDGERPARIAQV